MCSGPYGGRAHRWFYDSDVAGRTYYRAKRWQWYIPNYYGWYCQPFAAEIIQMFEAGMRK